MKRLILRIIFLYISVVFVPIYVFAADVTIPGAADAGRISRDRENKFIIEPEKVITPQITKLPIIKAPLDANNISFIMHSISIDGAEAFSPEQLEPLYKQYIEKKITLDKAWEIANIITKFYQEQGYFLSRAYVPEQAFGEGDSVKIKVVEGYAQIIEFDDHLADNYIVKDILNSIKKSKPLNINVLESAVLRLNDINGAQFRAVIQPLKNDNNLDGAVKIVFFKERQKISGSVSIDNYNSKYIGPFEDTISLKGSPGFQNETSLTFLNSMPWIRERYVTVNHNITLSSMFSSDIYGSYAKSYPGYTLEEENVESTAASFGTSLNMSIIRQRQENLAFKIKFDAKNVATDILYTPITRDHVRVARFITAYDRNDILGGHDFFNITASHGVPELGASKSTDDNLSRTGVDPKFKKIELNVTRYQNIGKWTAITSTAMQFAEGPMYSSEQIGYGGQSFGRAYDSSEILGDNGMLGGLELRYNALPSYKSINFIPYGFYDLGKVWSVNDVSSYRNSTGVGMRIDSGSGFYANFTIAQPLTHKINTPPYGNGKNPHILMEAGLRF